jgi:hypothetical protein
VFAYANLRSAMYETIATTTSATHDITVLRSMQAISNTSNGMVWFVLTATNSDATTRSRITSLDVWPEMTEGFVGETTTKRWVA